MSRFHYEDLVELRSDARVKGVVHVTWSDLSDSDPAWNNEEILYVHSSTPRKILRIWRKEQRLVPGYVIIEFMLPGDGFCLIQEDDLCLRDRHFFLGDIVQRHASDHQSGRVMSMSSHCTLQPVCSPEEYANAPPAASQGRSPSHAQNTGGSHLNSPEMQETPQLDQIEVLASRQLSEFTVSARDLRNLQDFQEGDRVIYGNAIGSVAEIQVEVTVRLANGSVVVVEDTGELDVPLYVPGSSSRSRWLPKQSQEKPNNLFSRRFSETAGHMVLPRTICSDKERQSSSWEVAVRRL